MVGPTKTKPSPLQLLGHRRSTPGVGRRDVGRASPGAGRGRSGAKDHSSASRAPPGSSLRGPGVARRVAAILARLRTMPASAISRASSSASNAATASIEKPAKAARNAGRLRRIVIHDSPDWNASRHEPLEQGVVAVQRRPPLLVVVGDVLGVRPGPGAALHARDRSGGDRRFSGRRRPAPRCRVRTARRRSCGGSPARSRPAPAAGRARCPG